MRATPLVCLLLMLSHAAAAQTCPAVIESATRLVFVTAASMNTKAARLVLYVRDKTNTSWRQQGTAQAVSLGESGMAWGTGFMQFARRGEPVMRERGHRTPAGIYRIGAPFGFAPSKRPNYVRLKAGETFCVDDMRSPAYNTITTMALAGHVSGERMRNISQYRHGLFLDYPSTYAKPAGSCIFIHAWNVRDEATAGCVAMPDASVIALQDFATPRAVIAIMPRPALARFKGCLPDAGAR